MDEFRKSTFSVTGECVSVGVFRKSSYSNPSGNCIEVGGDWRKSGHSVKGNCVEIASGVRVRDTKDEGNGPVLSFTPEQWTAFTRGLIAR